MRKNELKNKVGQLFSDVAICRVFTPSDRPRAEVDTSLRRSPKMGIAVKDQRNIGSGTAKRRSVPKTSSISALGRVDNY